MSKPKHTPGEIIELCWESHAEQLFCYGHIDPEAAAEAFRKEHDDFYEFMPPEPRYARWSCEPGEDGCRQVLRDYPGPGRGRFPVMMAEVTHINFPKYEEARV